MIITSFYSFLLIDLQSYKLFKFMQIFCRRKKTQKHHQRDGSFDGVTTYIINTHIKSPQNCTITQIRVSSSAMPLRRKVGILRVFLVVENEIPWEIPRLNQYVFCKYL